MNRYRDVSDREGVCEHARCEWVTFGLVALGLIAGWLLVGVVA